MPTYEYRCTKCGFRFESFQSISEKPLRSCPECKGDVERLIGSGAGVLFKGTGFYETDYKRKPEGTKKEETTKTAVKETSVKPS
ncbi:zinc ribbon domain-containing protein [bacterium]|nr:zinc ribbon domain-containing protein [bacterium]